MKTILVTGSAGFIGKHLLEALRRRPDTAVVEYDLGVPPADLERGLREADVIYHLAGVNRPQDPGEFKTGNADFTESLCARLFEIRGKDGSPSSGLRPLPLFVLSSSIQAELENPYGTSKRRAELAVGAYAQRAAEISDLPSPAPGAPRAIIFRLTNVFGKWCRPNYNSVTATFCHNIAHDLPITISDPGKELELVYIDDVIAAFLSVMDSGPTRDLRTFSTDPLAHRMGEGQGEGVPPTSDLRPLTPDSCVYCVVPRSFNLTLGELAAKIRSFRASRTSLVMPSFDDALTRCLYATYLSYLDGADFGYNLEIKTDHRGCLAEFMKSAQLGQLFVSRTKPGITRGNHYHHTKTEKFFVVEGEAVIRFRKIVSERKVEETTDHRPQTPDLQPAEIIEHRVSGKDFKVVDIPPGYTHSIENVGGTEMVVLFWASEVFDPQRADTYPMAVRG